jgi:toxin CcdB
MAQFDVYENADPETSELIPYLLDVQSNDLSGFGTRVVVPLYRLVATDGTMTERLVPIIRMRDSDYSAMTPELAGVPVSNLGHRVANVANSRDRIVSAIDLLITGI